MVTCKACKKNFHKKKAANMAKHGGKCSKCQKIKPPVKTSFCERTEGKTTQKVA